MRKTKAVPKKEEQSQEAPPSEESSVVEESGKLLDEIDSLLEEQAVLVDFRQRSGQ